MAKRGNVFLMYHELERPGRSLSQTDPGYVRYIVTENDFRAQMEWLGSSGLAGTSVGSSLHEPERPAVVITFDDGCETDFLVAAPILKQLGFGATFYVTSGFLSKPGYMSIAQLRELSCLGFEIGCHSMTHPYLPDVDEAGLRREMVGAKNDLEQILGTAVEHFSCPGGQCDDRVVAVAREGGYQSVATSEIRANDADTDRFALGRVAILRGMRLGTFSQICDGRILWKLRLRDRTNRAAKRALGNSSYDRLRSMLLGAGSN
jgi:peptidoglycan/xylan/chitin deacetylase (PgdA/CDA1 family)